MSHGHTTVDKIQWLRNSQERGESREQCHGALIANRGRESTQEVVMEIRWTGVAISSRRPGETGAESVVEGAQLCRVGSKSKSQKGEEAN